MVFNLKKQAYKGSGKLLGKKKIEPQSINFEERPPTPFTDLIRKELYSEGQSTMPAQDKETPRANVKTPEAYIDTKTGKPSGISKNGKSFLGGSADIVQEALAREAQSRQLPAGINKVGTEQNIINSTAEMQQQQARNAELMQMAQQGLLSPQELQQIQGASPDIGQSIGAGAIDAALIGGSAGLGIGAAAGLGVATPITAPAGAAIGALFGFIKGVKNNIKGQQTEEFAADQAALSKGERMLRSLITDTNQNPQNAPENIALFYQTMNMIDAAHQKTWKDSQEDLNRFLGNDGTTQLAKFETFDNSMRLYYINRFQTALSMPDPTQILITNEELEEYNEEEN